jgi:pyruvate formate-lyase activating enzyme-like uncharacterized protein
MLEQTFPYCPFPRYLMVQTTSRCNAACVFCPYPTVRREVSQGEMSFTLFVKLMRECSRYEVKGISLFLMNEPLMDPCIVDRITVAKEHNPLAGISLWSNGCNLTEKLSLALIHSGLDAIGISVPRPTGGSWAGTISSTSSARSSTSSSCETAFARTSRWRSGSSDTSSSSPPTKRPRPPSSGGATG